jgi:superoxide dismutase, Cu-Zn family
MMIRRVWMSVLVVGAIGCGGGDAEPGEEMLPVDSAAAPGAASGVAPGGAADTATAMLQDSAGAQVGTARFAATDGGVEVQVEVSGLPAGAHGVHVHMTGRCEPADTAFSSAGGHLNPGDRQHGLENPAGPHAGDLPNLEVGADGGGTLTATALRDVPDAMSALLDADGAALIVHANEDDQQTDDGPEGPGNSGARIACGVVSR